RRLGHAADHHLQAQAARFVDHAARRRQAAALDQLNVDAVKMPRTPGDVGLDLTAFVSDHWQDALGDDALHFIPAIGRQRLLDEFHAELLEQRRVGDRLLRRPAAIDVDARSRIDMLSQRAHDLDIVRRAELNLIDRPARKLLQFGDHRWHVRDANGVVARRNVVEAQAPQLPYWLAAQLAEQ